MNDIDWRKIAKVLLIFGETLSQAASEPIREGILQESSSTLGISSHDDNPLLILPFDVRENITTEYYETGMSSMAQKYIEEHYLVNKNHMALQKVMNDIYYYAVRKDKHILSYNIMIVLSQLPYKYLGSWACLLAVAATRNKYMDVNEIGIRCFENWEDKEACTFLKQCSFSESWLQDYADEVSAYITKDGSDVNVLFEKDFTWQVAGRKLDSSSNIEGYRSGYSSSGV